MAYATDRIGYKHRWWNLESMMSFLEIRNMWTFRSVFSFKEGRMLCFNALDNSNWILLETICLKRRIRIIK